MERGLELVMAMAFSVAVVGISEVAVADLTASSFQGVGHVPTSLGSESLPGEAWGMPSNGSVDSYKSGCDDISWNKTLVLSNRNMHVYSYGEPTTLVDEDRDLRNLSQPPISNDRMVLLEEQNGDEQKYTGILRGTDPTNDKVIYRQDLLFGYARNHLQSGPFLNNMSQSEFISGLLTTSELEIARATAVGVRQEGSRIGSGFVASQENIAVTAFEWFSSLLMFLLVSMLFAIALWFALNTVYTKGKRHIRKRTRSPLTAPVVLSDHRRTIRKKQTKGFDESNAHDGWPVKSGRGRMMKPEILRWKRVGDTYDLRLANPQIARISELRKLFTVVEETESWGRHFNRIASIEFNRWLDNPDTPLREQAYARLSNWFLCDKQFIRETALGVTSGQFWDALFCARPEHRLTDPKRGHKILPKQFELWGEKQETREVPKNAVTGKRRVGLQKGLAEILEGVSMPEEARRRGSASGDTPNQTAHYTLRDRIALFEEIARRRKGGTPIWLPPKAREPLQNQIGANEEPKEATEQCAVELIYGKDFASHILGISKRRFWLLRKLGRIGPKPVEVSGTLKWELSSVLRWFDWRCCDMTEFQARKERSR